MRIVEKDQVNQPQFVQKTSNSTSKPDCFDLRALQASNPAVLTGRASGTVRAPNLDKASLKALEGSRWANLADWCKQQVLSKSQLKRADSAGLEGVGQCRSLVWGFRRLIQ